MSQIFPLKGVVQHYAWGGKSFIPELIKTENTHNQPFAELWMGTHNRGAAEIKIASQNWNLQDYLQKYPEVLGANTIQKFGHELPFLFKILDVNAMLSIQSHPTKEQAEIGYHKENQAGIPLTAKHRNYKDDNHKPELMVALTDFWLLHGFQSVEKIQTILQNVTGFQKLEEKFKEGAVIGLYQYIMELPQEEINSLLQPLFEELTSKNQQNLLQKDQADYWAFKAFEQYTSEDGNFDRGIFSIYLFNLVFIEKGKGIFQDAGIPHAYLEGVNVEIMANSDNVFRGGLTPKYVDVPELMANLVFDSISPKIISGQQLSESEIFYPTPAPDFGLSQIRLNENQTHEETAQSAQIYIVMEGEVISDDEHYLKGQSFFVPAETKYKLSSKKETILFKSFVP